VNDAHTLPKDPPVDGKSLGAGMSMGEWLAKPDKQVTRRELWDFLRYVETVRQNKERRNRWWRRLWRHLNEPIVEYREDA
jgi:hypothetical protein